MAKVKFTKTALKQQRDALRQFQRFLPTLQLKKQQLQLEMRSCLERIEANRKREDETKRSLDSWSKLLGDSEAVAGLSKKIAVKNVETSRLNIAGVDVPVFEKVIFQPAGTDLYRSDPWVDDAIEALEKIVSIREERRIIREQYDRIAGELRITTQRVNLFEKVKIPECLQNIRAIQIYIGDMSTAAVARSKIAKKKLQETAA